MIEQSLVKYVLETADGNAKSVLKEIEKFSWNNWMMHVGEVKGAHIDEEIKKRDIKRCLEIGTYCGYSSIRTASLLPDDGHVYTIEPDAERRNIAQQLINKAGLTSKITILPGYSHDVIPGLIGTFDYVFIDHIKEAYYNDLLLIEQHNLLKSGSLVVADNVIVFGKSVGNYLDHVKNSGKYVSKTIKSMLEFSEEHVDGIEVSVFK